MRGCVGKRFARFVKFICLQTVVRICVTVYFVPIKGKITNKIRKISDIDRIRNSDFSFQIYKHFHFFIFELWRKERRKMSLSNVNYLQWAIVSLILRCTTMNGSCVYVCLLFSIFKIYIHISFFLLYIV